MSLFLNASPSLKPYLPETLTITYKLGLNIAVRETGLFYETFPSECPYPLEKVLDQAFLFNLPAELTD